MWHVSRRNSKPIAVLSLVLISVASLSGCANWLEELRAQEDATKLAKVAASSPSGAPKLPNLPAEINTCLMKRACQEEAATAKATGKPKPECTTADGIVIAYVQSEKEKQACTLRLAQWWRKQQKIQEDAASSSKHPRSVPKTAGWP